MKRARFVWMAALVCGVLLLSCGRAEAQRFGFSFGGPRGGFSFSYGRGYYGGYGPYGVYRPGISVGVGGYPGYGYSYPYRYYDAGFYPGYYYSMPAYSSVAPTYYAAPYATPAYDTGSAARIEVRLSDGNAEVWFDGHKTRQTGTSRTFTTPALEPGSYTYQISAAWYQGDRLVTQERHVTVRPGASTLVDFEVQTLPTPRKAEEGKPPQ